MANHPNRSKVRGMQTFQFVDPDWNDKTPLEIVAQHPLAAARKYYTETLIEPAPKMYAEESKGRPGSATFGSIGDTRVVRYVVTTSLGRVFNIYFH